MLTLAIRVLDAKHLHPTGFMFDRLLERVSTLLSRSPDPSDLLITMSCLAIPVALFYLILRRPDVPFRPVYWLLGAFLFASGVTHILEFLISSATIPLLKAAKCITGLISAATVLALLRTLPRALSLRSPSDLERELEDHHRAGEAVAVRTRQLETMVELSHRAVVAGDPGELAGEVAVLMARGLGVSLCGIFRALPDRAGLQLWSGVGWRDGLVGTATVPAGVGSLAGFVAQQAGAIVDQVPEAEERFRISLLEREHGVIGGMGVEVYGSDGLHGVLVAYTTQTEPCVLIAHTARRRFGDDEMSFLRSVAGLFGSNLSRIEAERALTKLANTDGLTGLHNARHLREALPMIGMQASRKGDPLSVIMLDIDRFKSFNDSFGHPGGDDVLCQVGAILRREARSTDLVARYGGEEFAIVLPGANAAEARGFAERVRYAIASHPWALRPVTASLGVASSGPGIPIGVDLVAEADQALYLAKRTGRNRVVHHDEVRDEEEPHSDWPESYTTPAEGATAGGMLLHIDDDAGYRRLLGRHLAEAELAVVGASSAAEGLRRTSEGFDLILLDVRLPDEDGLDVCRRLKADPVTAMTPILLLSEALLYGEDRARALAAGASAALPKSTEPAELMAVISALLRARRYERELIRTKLGMSERLREQAAELERVCDATIEGFARALELRDHETEGHSRRVTEMAVKVGRRMGLSEAELVHLRRGALLHDIGKVGVPDAILSKAGPLDDAEWVVMRRHPELAYHLLKPIEFLQSSLDIPYCHHERWDGQGYPNGRRCDEIPLPARIFAAVDVHDALSHDRPYRKAWPAERVKEHIRSLAGTHLDPAVIEAMLTLL